MTTHELAKKLLELPDIVVVHLDGNDPPDWEEVRKPYKKRTMYYNDQGWHTEEVVRIT